MQQEQDIYPASGDHAPGEDLPAPDPAGRPAMAVPPSLFVWLALLLLTFAVPTLLPTKKDKASSAKEQTLTATQFSDLTEAEAKVRSAFGVEALQSGIGGLAGTSGAFGSASSQGQKSLDQAAKTYRGLLKSHPTPGILRRIFVIDHARDRPLDSALVTGSLPSVLKDTGVKPKEIALEQKLWSGVYGKPVSVSASDLPAFTRLLQGTKLGFLKDRALADLYEAAGKKSQAESYESAFDSAARSAATKQGALGIGIGAAFLAGLVVLVIFLVAAISRNWRLIHRQATQPQVLGWGDLLDAFLFYMAMSKVLGLVASFVLSKLSIEPKPETMLTFYASMQAGTGLLSVLYFWRTARKRGVTLEDIGFRAPRGLLSEIGYGIGGYCAALPVVLLLSWFSRFIFQHDATRTPNPIMPLMANEQDLFRRFIIFLMVAVGAPLFEELFFRGALFSGLRTRYNWVLAAAISGIVFAIAHPPQDWLPIFGLGFALATMREMRQSLVPSIAAHFMQNSFAFIASSILFGQ